MRGTPWPILDTNAEGHTSVNKRQKQNTHYRRASMFFVAMASWKYWFECKGFVVWPLWNATVMLPLQKEKEKIVTEVIRYQQNIYIYIYIHIERERHVCVYIYMYIYVDRIMIAMIRSSSSSSSSSSGSSSSSNMCVHAGWISNPLGFEGRASQCVVSKYEKDNVQKRTWLWLLGHDMEDLCLNA